MNDCVDHRNKRMTKVLSTLIIMFVLSFTMGGRLGTFSDWAPLFGKLCPHP